MAGNAAMLGAAIGLGQGWAATFAALNAGLTMAEAHGHPSVLYGPLVLEGSVGNILVDTLGIDEYFD